MSALNFGLKEILEEGCDFTKEIGASEIGIEDNDCRLKGNLELSLHLQLFRNDGAVAVEGSVSGTVVYQCVRCLVDFDQSFELPFSGIFQEKETWQSHRDDVDGVGEKEEKLDGFDSVDSYPLVEGRVDVGNLIREQIVLMVPMNPVCHDHCLGLCPVCGQDRNQWNCECREIAVGSPFACLQDWRGTSAASKSTKVSAQAPK